MYPRALTPVMASLVFGTSVQPSYAYADEGYDLAGDSARLGADGAYEVSGVIETADAGAPRGASYHGPRIPTPTAHAARLVASEDTCMGSRTFGLQLAGFGVSFGSTWQDRQCMRIKNARQLDALGYRRAAIALLCQDDDVFDAMERAGTPCPGLELVTFAPPPEPAAEPPLISFDDVLFDFDRSTLRPEADAILAPALDLLQADPEIAIEIEGHTDWVGSDAYNDGLSQRRAEAVVEWLVARGIDRERITAVGRGESEPVATNATAGGRQLNRRVEVRRRMNTAPS